MAAKYSGKDVADWNVQDFLDYMSDKHVKMFMCDYQPFGGWQAERGRLGTAIGTAKKSGKYSKDVIKEFIDECFRQYRPSPQYPGISFGFMMTYKGDVLAKVQKKNVVTQKDEKDRISELTDDVLAWLNS